MSCGTKLAHNYFCFSFFPFYLSYSYFVKNLYGMDLYKHVENVSLYVYDDVKGEYCCSVVVVGCF